MTEMAFQDVFNRVYLYLIASGTDMTGERFRALLQLIDDAITKASREGGAVSVLEIAMDMVPGRFTVPPEKNMEVHPPLKRGSIGYRPVSNAQPVVK
ncbi:MAG TPA: hypothetical protein VL091_08940 [Marinobacter sp.]|nr:hypothetical protein [Marinobacter sp.]